MEPCQLLAIFDRQQRRDIECFGFRREVTPEIVRHMPLEGHSGGGFVLYSRLSAANADRVIAAEIARFAAGGLEFEWKLYGHDTPSDLGQRLLAQGFHAEEPEALMVLDLQVAPASLWEPVTHDIRRVLAPALIEHVVTVEEAVWGESFSGLGQQLAAELRDCGDRLYLYLAYADGMPVCTAWARFHPPTQFASLWGGSTLPAYRGRGLYAALLAVRAQAARQHGYRFLTVDASPMSRPILEKHGFSLLTFSTPYKWRPE